jgi:hypothetical protein
MDIFEMVWRQFLGRFKSEVQHLQTQYGNCSPPPSVSKQRTQNHSAEGKLSACAKAIALKLQLVSLICPKQ